MLEFNLKNMKKYELIKRYPGSPELGTIASPYTDCKDRVVHYSVTHPTDLGCYLAIPKKDIEDNPEYWEEVKENIWWCVWKTDGFFKSWTPYRVECETVDKDKNRFYYKSKEEAKNFIIHNKPCLSYNDIRWIFEENTKKNTVSIDIDKLIEIIKTKYI